jgi:hypothetical protein
MSINLMKSVFAEGVVVQYRNWVGEIRFICDEYASVCTSVGVHRSSDVCVLVYKRDWEEMKLFKESHK